MMNKVFYGLLALVCINVMFISFDYVFFGIEGIGNVQGKPNFLPSGLDVTTSYEGIDSNNSLYDMNTSGSIENPEDTDLVDAILGSAVDLILRIPFFGDLINLAITFNDLIDLFVFYWMNSISRIPLPAPFPFMLSSVFFFIKLAFKFSLFVILISTIGGLIK